MEELEYIRLNALKFLENKEESSVDLVGSLCVVTPVASIICKSSNHQISALCALQKFFGPTETLFLPSMCSHTHTSYPI
jgi:hypothetical protein